MAQETDLNIRCQVCGTKYEVVSDADHCPMCGAWPDEGDDNMSFTTVPKFIDPMPRQGQLLGTPYRP